MSEQVAPGVAVTGLLNRARAAGVTPAGGWLAMVIGTAFVLGSALGWVELWIVAFAGAVVAALALVFTLGRQAYLIDLDLAGRRVPVGEPLPARLIVANTSSGRILPARLDLPVGGEVVSFPIPSMAGRTTKTLSFAVPTHRRAHLTIGPVTTARSDPFGLISTTNTWAPGQDLFIHPETIQLPMRGGGFVRDLEGNATNELARADVSFHGLRDYVAGDDRRLVHWRSTARTRRLVVRQFTESRRSVLAVGIDTTHASWRDEDEAELGVSVAASLALQALRDNNPLDFRTTTRAIPAASVTGVLDAAAGLRFEPAGGIGTLAREVEKSTAGASMVILVTGSAVRSAELQRACALFGIGVRVLGVRVAAAPLLVRTVGRVTTITLNDLGQLPRALRQAARS